ncbi:MAG: T9SS type A sorting domain-containing protein, partial [Ignavibacteria bacterium]|nr:T9SS type A sorting domain-containing protein [Ignavibacteria bacterium]
TVIKTNNQGLSWTNISINIKSAINSVYFFNSLTGFASGDNTAIFKTTNGGVNWLDISPAGETANFEEIVMFDISAGIALSDLRGNSGIFRTVNGGLNWTRLTNPGISFLYTTAARLNESNAIVFGTDVSNNTFHAYKSTDKGASWITAFSSDSLEFFSSFTVNSQTVFAMSMSMNNFYIVKTTDGGDTWSIQKCNDIEPFGLWLNQCTFINSLTGYAAGTQYASPGYIGRIFKTTNGGQNWTYTQLADSTISLAGVWANNNRVYTVGQGGYIARSLNSGNSFSRSFRTLTLQNINDVSFVNSNTGIVVCGAGEIYKTSNGGINWFRQYIDSAFSLTGCKMVDASTGYINSAARVYKTTNGGLNWLKILIVNSASWSDIDAPSANYCVVTGGCPNAFVSTSDGGMTWEGVSTALSCNSGPIQVDVTQYSGVSMPSPGLIAMIGSTNYPHAGSVPKAFLKRGSGLLSTIFIGELQTPQMTTIDFYDSLTGFYSGNYRLRRKTTDGGLNWTDYGENLPGYAALELVRFASSSVLYGEGGNIKSTDGGQTWIDIPFITEEISDMDCVNENIVFSVGSHGKIVKLNNSGVVGTVNVGNNIPGRFSLGQNFPNPFNPVTGIRVDVPSKSNVKLIVYDVIGKEVMRLLDKEVEAGIHTVHFDGINLPSGVYFYRLQAGDFSETKKMILVK